MRCGDNGEQGWTVVEDVKGGQDDAQLAVNARVRVNPDSETESVGVIVEDFGGDMQNHGVDLGGEHFADPARRWAVMLDSGDLVFVDTHQLAPE
jgi:hypothetical protein